MSFGLMPSFSANSLTVEPSTMRTAFNSPEVAGVSSRPAMRCSSVSTGGRSEEHTSELQSHHDLVCRLLLEKKKKDQEHNTYHTTTADKTGYPFTATRRTSAALADD